MGVQCYFFLNIFSLIISFNFQNVPPYQYILSLCILNCLPSLSLCCLTCSNELLSHTSLLSLSFCCLKCWPSRNVVGLYLLHESVHHLNSPNQTFCVVNHVNSCMHPEHGFPAPMVHLWCDTLTVHSCWLLIINESRHCVSWRKDSIGWNPFCKQKFNKSSSQAFAIANGPQQICGVRIILKCAEENISAEIKRMCLVCSIMRLSWFLNNEAFTNTIIPPLTYTVLF